MRTETRVVVDYSSFGKIDEFGSVCSVQWHHTVAVSQHALRAALHIVTLF